MNGSTNDPHRKADGTMKTMQVMKRSVGAVWSVCGTYFRSVFDLTSEERRVVMLIAALFILGLVVRLLRG